MDIWPMAIFRSALELQTEAKLGWKCKRNLLILLTNFCSSMLASVVAASQVSTVLVNS